MARAIRFPNETEEYRRARDELTKLEIELRDQTEAVAAARRRLPPGGEVREDYVFDEGAADIADTTTSRKVRLSELFGDKDTLVLYSYMYGPKAKAPCPMCTSMLDALEGNAEHVSQQVALAVNAKSPIARVRDFARGRGWRRLRLVSSAESSYQRDYFGEDDEGAQMPMMNVFTRAGGKVRHAWGSEMLYAVDRDAKMDSRHIDMIWPLWNVLDLTPRGRGDWYPKLSYS
jgi:predicted dithiol-disulfide oxidoreductase (DUF899 family)